MGQRIIHSTRAAAAVGPYEQGICAGNLVFTSGQLGIEPETGKLREGIEEQTRQAMQNLGEILRAAGSGYEKIVKCTLFVQDLADFSIVNVIYGSYFQGAFPARSCVQVAKLPLGGLVEIECVAEI